MREHRYRVRISDILGVSLFLMSVLYFLSERIRGGLGESVFALFLKALLLLPVYFGPIFFVYFGMRRFSFPMPSLSKDTLDYSESAMLAISTLGAVVLMQTLYASLFPSTVRVVGVEGTDSVFGFLLLFFGAVVLPALLEEIFFRGVVLRSLSRHRALLAILISSLISALMRFSVEQFPLAFFCSFLIGSVYYATGSLATAAGIHMLASGVWFLSETVAFYSPEGHELFLRIAVGACVLLFAFGVPFLKKTVQALLADEHDGGVLPSAQFWGIPITLFLIFAALLQILMTEGL